MANIGAVKSVDSLKSMTIALLVTQNTKNAAHTTKALKVVTVGSMPIDRIFTELPKILGKHFKTVIPIETIEDAADAKADLIAIVDLYPTIPHIIALRNIKMDLKVFFLDANRKEVDSIQVLGKKLIPIWGETPVGPWVWAHTIIAAENDALEKLDAALASSTRLADFRAPNTAPAAAPAKVFSSEVDEPRYQDKANENSFAVVIGIERYTSLPKAQFAERDANAVRAHLLAMGYPDRNIAMLIGPQATRSGMEKYLEDWLPGRVKEDSRVFVYFSGHGSPDLATSAAYLVPWDGDPKYLSTTGYPLKRLYEKLNALSAKRVIVALDSCFSGAGGRSVLPEGTRPLVTRVDNGAAAAGKLVIFSASGADEVTGTSEGQGHGLFTYYFLRGLSGDAGSAGGGVTVQSLYDYLSPKVQDMAMHDNREQTPRLMTDASQETKVLRIR